MKITVGDGTFGGMGVEAERFHKRLAELIALKRHETYSSVINYIRTRLRFCLLKSVLTSLRGVRGKSKQEKISPVSTLWFGLIDFDEWWKELEGVEMNWTVQVDAMMDK